MLWNRWITMIDGWNQWPRGASLVRLIKTQFATCFSVLTRDSRKLWTHSMSVLTGCMVYPDKNTSDTAVIKHCVMLLFYLSYSVFDEDVVAWLLKIKLTRINKLHKLCRLDISPSNNRFLQPVSSVAKQLFLELFCSLYRALSFLVFVSEGRFGFMSNFFCSCYLLKQKNIVCLQYINNLLFFTSSYTLLLLLILYLIFHL